MPQFLRHRWLAIIGLAMQSWVHAADVESATVPTRWRLETETWKLPANERMGVVSGHALLGAGSGWQLGVASYGAVRGNRGGFITLGVEGEASTQLSADWSAQAGLHVGAGGGRGGQQLAGGGLMLRSHAGLSYQVSPNLVLGAGLSHVRFPSGVIGSTQPYVRLDVPLHTALLAGWPNTRAVHSNGQGISVPAWPSTEQQVGVVVRQYRIPTSVKRDDGTPEHPRMQLMGISYTTQIRDQWFAKLEAEGAAGGQSNGYMQILAGGGYEWPLSPRTSLKLHAAAGPAGGGAADVGGGLLVDMGATLSYELSPHLGISLGLGQVRATSQSFKAQSFNLTLSRKWHGPRATASSPTRTELAEFDALPLRIRLAHQTYRPASTNWRNSFADQTIGNLGVQLDHFLSPNVYITGQGLAAHSGQAGAYMVGELGMGAHKAMTQQLYAEAEALVGAAGGGGVNVGGGLVAQVNAQLGYQFQSNWSAHVGTGRIQSRSGSFKANVIQAGLVYRFTGFGK